MKKLAPISIAVTLALLGYTSYLALVVAPTEQTMGDVQRIFYYHVPSGWVAGAVLLHQLRGFGLVPVEAQPSERRAGGRVGRSRRGVLRRAADHRAAVGASGVGHLVDLGCAPDDDAGAVAHLCQLPGAAALCRRRTNAGAGRGVRHLRLCRCAASCICRSAGFARSILRR